MRSGRGYQPGKYTQTWSPHGQAALPDQLKPATPQLGRSSFLAAHSYISLPAVFRTQLDRHTIFHSSPIFLASFVPSFLELWGLLKPLSVWLPERWGRDWRGWTDVWARPRSRPSPSTHCRVELLWFLCPIWRLLPSEFFSRSGGTASFGTSGLDRSS